ncbi:MAG: glycosyltransferase family 2 protein [Caldilineales bacterium]|nr:glycosyltransferase family 2 protein [Caldilineales bacterium]
MAIVNPLISVIVPVYNGADFLPGAVASIRAQTYRPIEIIIIDDGSTDETAAVASRLGDDIRYRYQPNQGPGSARNSGINLARADFIAFLDVDDLWPERKLERQMRLLQSDPSLAYVTGMVQVCHWTGEADGRSQFSPVGAPREMFLLGAVLFRKSVFVQVGLFDESMPGGEDTDWYFRARQASIPSLQSEEIALEYRLHQNNLTQGMNRSMTYFMYAMKKSVDRNRKAD